MGLRTGIERIATVIRGSGWLAALVSLVIGIGNGIGEGWQYPKQPNPFDAFDESKSSAPTKNARPLSEQFLLDATTPPAQGKKTFTYEEALAPREKVFSFDSIRFGYMLAGFAVGVVLLGLAYLLAWVLVGFAPGS